MALPLVPIALALSAASAGYGAYQSGKANDLRKKALSLEMERYREAAPFRQGALQLGSRGVPQQQDLSAGFADPSNPFYKPGAAAIPITTGGPAGGFDMPDQRTAKPRAQGLHGLLPPQRPGML